MGIFAPFSNDTYWLFWAEGPDDVPNKPIFDIVVVNGDAKDNPDPKKIENGPETVWPPVGKALQVFCNVTVPRGHAMTLTWFKKVKIEYKRRINVHWYNWLLYS